MTKEAENKPAREHSPRICDVSPKRSSTFDPAFSSLDALLGSWHQRALGRRISTPPITRDQRRSIYLAQFTLTVSRLTGEVADTGKSGRTDRSLDFPLKVAKWRGSRIGTAVTWSGEDRSPFRRQDLSGTSELTLSGPEPQASLSC